MRNLLHIPETRDDRAGFELSEMSQTSIDVIVPVYNAPEWVRPCLNSVAKNTEIPYRLIVVDDCSDFYTKRLLRELIREHRSHLILTNESNLGFLKSANIGMSAARSAYVVLLNSDAIVPPGWLPRLRNCLDSDPRIGIVNPLSNEAANLSVPIAPGCNFLGMAEALGRTRKPRYPDIVTAVGFCLMLRQQMLQELGLFDEIYDRGYCEETDLCLRAMKAGWRVVACDDLYAFHRGAATFTDGDERYKNNLRIFLQRHGPDFRKAYAAFFKAAPLKRLIGQASERPASKWRRCLSIGRTVIHDLAGAHPLRAWRHFKERQLTPQLHTDAARYRGFWRVHRPSVTFLFESLDSYGGVISVLKLVNGLIDKGFEVRIASLHRGKGLVKGLYTEPLYFGSAERLIAGVASSDIFISTFWSTAYWLPALRNRFPHAKLLSYLQDYESWFEPSSLDWSRRVLASYDVPDAIIATSSWLQLKLRALGKDSTVVPKGVDGDVFRICEGEGRQPLSVLAMARPHTYQRGFGNLVKIFGILSRQSPAVQLSFFGCDDSALDALGFRVRNFGVVENGGSLARIYNRHTIYLDASIFQGFGMTGLEAMACGCACVLTSVGGINEYAKDRRNALLFDPEDPNAAVGAINTLLNDEALRRRLVKHGTKTAEDFSLEREIGMLADVLERSAKTGQSAHDWHRRDPGIDRGACH